MSEQSYRYHGMYVVGSGTDWTLWTGDPSSRESRRISRHGSRDEGIVAARARFRMHTRKLDVAEEGEVTNNAGDGRIDGIGIGPMGEPGIRRAVLARIRRRAVDTGGRRR